jgi:ABC-type transport system involved in cytochrome bd biosynthesis fused ATPase/permease subunit
VHCVTREIREKWTKISSQFKPSVFSFAQYQSAFYTCYMVSLFGIGKTSLLNVLAGRAAGKIEGKLLLNGVPRELAGYKCRNRNFSDIS